MAYQNFIYTPRAHTEYMRCQHEASAYNGTCTYATNHPSAPSMRPVMTPHTYPLLRISTLLTLPVLYAPSGFDAGAMNKTEIQALLYDCTDRGTGSVDYETFLRGLANSGDLEAVKREVGIGAGPWAGPAPGPGRNEGVDEHLPLHRGVMRSKPPAVPPPAPPPPPPKGPSPPQSQSLGGRVIASDLGSNPAFAKARSSFLMTSARP